MNEKKLNRKELLEAIESYERMIRNESLMKTFTKHKKRHPLIETLRPKSLSRDSRPLLFIPTLWLIPMEKFRLKTPNFALPRQRPRRQQSEWHLAADLATTTPRSTFGIRLHNRLPTSSYSLVTTSIRTIPNTATSSAHTTIAVNSAPNTND